MTLGRTNAPSSHVPPANNAVSVFYAHECPSLDVYVSTIISLTSLLSHTLNHPHTSTPSSHSPPYPVTCSITLTPAHSPPYPPPYSVTHSITLTPAHHHLTHLLTQSHAQSPSHQHTHLLTHLLTQSHTQSPSHQRSRGGTSATMWCAMGQQLGSSTCLRPQVGG